MRYGILGPLEVTGDDGPVLVAGAKQRALLVLLVTPTGWSRSTG
jgi:hypothetical protein